MGVTARATGLDRLCSRVDAVIEGVAAELDAAVEAQTKATQDDERALVPYLTGELHDGIVVWFTDGDIAGVRTGHVGIRDPELWWAEFIEWGRQSAPAQPFATPAAELARQAWPGRARRALAAGVRSR